VHALTELICCREDIWHYSVGKSPQVLFLEMSVTSVLTWSVLRNQASETNQK